MPVSVGFAFFIGIQRAWARYYADEVSPVGRTCCRIGIARSQRNLCLIRVFGVRCEAGIKSAVTVAAKAARKSILSIVVFRIPQALQLFVRTPQRVVTSDDTQQGRGRRRLGVKTS